MAVDRRLLVALFLLLAVGFYIANHGAFKGYFQDDDLDNLSFTREVQLKDFFLPLLWPRVFDNNFRPVGHFFYHVMQATAGLHYTPYIVFIQCFHLLNVALLWVVLRRLKLSIVGACAGALFWAFHMALFDVFWKPMYVFDLFCGFFCLLSLLAFLEDRWILSVLAMWLGYRSKEVAIMLPVVIAGYEFLLGQRRWKRLLPFFALSLILGLQALFQNHVREESSYSLHLDLSSLWTCIRFYSSRILLVPLAGIAVVLLFLVRDRRVIFGALSFCALLVPMLLLPGRLYSAYLYVPLIGLGVAAGSLAEKRSATAIAAFFAVWLPWNYVNLRWERNVFLSDAPDRRTYVRRMGEFAQANPDVRTFIANHGPYNVWGTHGAIRLVYPFDTKILFATVDDPNLREVKKSPPLGILNWDPGKRDLEIVVNQPGAPGSSYLQTSAAASIVQLDQGWFPQDGAFRWIAPKATAQLFRPAGARHFQIVANVGPELLKQVTHSRVTVLVNGKTIGERDFVDIGYQTARWNLEPASPGPADVEFRVEPAFHTGDSKPLGIAIVSFGFVD